MSSAVNMQITLFILLITGFFLYKMKYINDTSKANLTDIIINIFLPCSIIKSFDIEFDKSVVPKMAMIFCTSFVVQIIQIIIAKLIFGKKFPEKWQSVLQYGIICSNASFIGLPVLNEIIGSEGVMLGAVALIPQRIFMWSAGLSLFTKSDAKSVVKRIVTHPCIVSVFIGMAVMIIPFDLPAPLSLSISFLGECTTGCSMIVIGAIIASSEKIIDIKHLPALMYYSAWRLLIIPVIIGAICFAFKIRGEMLLLQVILAGMPAGTTTAIIPSKYGGGDTAFAAELLCTSTLLSVPSIAFLCYLINLM